MASTPPKQYFQVKQRHPELMAAVEALGDAASRDGPLDAKTAHLIQLAAAAAMRSEGAVHSHTKRALDAGATPAELRHAVTLLTSTVGFPGMVAALSWVDDILEA